MLTMADDKTIEMGDDAEDTAEEHDVCVTLERPVAIPGPNSEPAQTEHFRAREYSVQDDFHTFYGLNVGPEHATVSIRIEAIRGIAHLP